MGWVWVWVMGCTGPVTVTLSLIEEGHAGESDELGLGSLAAVHTSVSKRRRGRHPCAKGGEEKQG